MGSFKLDGECGNKGLSNGIHTTHNKSHSRSVTRNQIIVKTICRDMVVNLFIDTGAHISLVNTKLIYQMNLDHKVQSTSIKIAGLSKKIIPSLRHEIILLISIENFSINNIFPVCDTTNLCKSEVKFLGHQVSSKVKLVESNKTANSPTRVDSDSDSDNNYKPFYKPHRLRKSTRRQAPTNAGIIHIHIHIVSYDTEDQESDIEESSFLTANDEQEMNEQEDDSTLEDEVTPDPPTNLNKTIQPTPRCESPSTAEDSLNSKTWERSTASTKEAFQRRTGLRPGSGRGIGDSYSYRGPGGPDSSLPVEPEERGSSSDHNLRKKVDKPKK